MSDAKISWRWMKVMYWYTLIGAGGFGLGIVFFPRILQSVFQYPPQDRFLFGAFGCVLIAFGVLCALGLRDPLKYAPALLMQLVYKSIWFLAVVIPAVLTGELPMYRILLIVVFASYVIGDLFAVPFAYLFCKSQPTEEEA